MQPGSALTARRASSSWAVGMPNTAMTASPANFCTVPPCLASSVWAAPYQRPITWERASGSSRSPSPVEPLRSLKTTVTTLRAPAGRPATAGRGRPQARQKRARSGFGSAQFGQSMQTFRGGRRSGS